MNLLEKYKPESLEEIVGHSQIVQSILEWIRNFRPGKAVLLHGPSGIGKNIIIEVIAKTHNFNLLQLNASDNRSAEDIDNFSGTTQTKSLFQKGKIILIDEIDGISGNDRGAVSSIAKLIKNSKYPVFLIANNPWAAKLLPLRSYCEFVKLNKIPSPSIEKKLREICAKEKININPEILKNIAKHAEGDLRAAINDLDTLSHAGPESIGYREREKSIFDVLPIIFNSQNLNVARQAMFSSDKDSDEIFWWIENNIHLVFKSPEEIANAFDLLSKADIFRSNVLAQQNWRFKTYMTDLMAGISLMKKEKTGGFIPYQPPRRFSQLGATKKNRELMNSICQRIGEITHSSKKVVRRDFLPFMKIILAKNKKEDFGFLAKEDVQAIKAN